MADELALPTYADVEAAARRIAPYAVRTPLLENAVLNERIGARIFLKPEVLQRTGSFKFRGAFNRLAAIPAEERANGVVAFSSGNHAQGVAAAATILGMPAVIVMPADAPKAKLEGTRRLGGTIVTYDRYREDREAIARGICAERGATLVPSFNDPFVVAGQGTIGLEIATDLAASSLKADFALVPCGGGGLSSGTALGLASPQTTVFAVEPQNYDGMGRSLRAGSRTTAPGGTPSIADALLTQVPGDVTFGLGRRVLAGGLSVSDAEIERAVSFAFRALKLVVEPGGAAALGAVLAEKVDLKNKTAVVVLSGGNCDLDVFESCCETFPDP